MLNGFFLRKKRHKRGIVAQNNVSEPVQAVGPRYERIADKVPRCAVVHYLHSLFGKLPLTAMDRAPAFCCFGYNVRMPRKPKPQADDPAESKRFIDMARELGADETEKGREAFERAFTKVSGRTDKPQSPKKG
jgi:hypothetical protein